MSSNGKTCLFEPGGSDDESDWEDLSVCSNDLDEEENRAPGNRVGGDRGHLDGTMEEEILDQHPSERKISMDEDVTPALVLSLSEQSESLPVNTGKDDLQETEAARPPTELEEAHKKKTPEILSSGSVNDDSSPRRNHQMSDKILERTEWLSRLFHSDSSPPSKHSSAGAVDEKVAANLTIAKSRRSQLVAERLEMLLEQVSPEKKGGQTHYPNESHQPIKIPEGLAADLSKKWQAFIAEHANAEQTWEKLERRQQWRKSICNDKQMQQTSSPKVTALFPNAVGYHEATCREQESVPISVADKAAWFLQQVDEKKTTEPDQHDFLTMLIEHEDDWVTITNGTGTNAFSGNSDTELTGEDSSFLVRALQTFEQEGLLPIFLAEWIDGPIGVNNCRKDTHAPSLDSLRLDYQPDSQHAKDSQCIIPDSDEIEEAPKALAEKQQPPPAPPAPKQRQQQCHQQQQTLRTTAAATTALTAPRAVSAKVSPTGGNTLNAREPVTHSNARKGLLHRTRLSFLNPESYSESFFPKRSRHQHQIRSKGCSKKSCMRIGRDESLTFNDHAIFLEDGALLMAMPWSEMS